MGEIINVYVGSNTERKHLSFDSRKERDKKAKELRAEGGIMMTENTTPLTTTPTTTISIRVKPELKKEAEELFDSCGLSLSQAFQVFLKQSIRVGGLPFIVRADKKPNPQTLMAMEETEALLKDPKAKKFSSVDELFEELDE